MGPFLLQVWFNSTIVLNNKVTHSIPHLSHLLTFIVDAFELAEQKNFALDIPQADQEPQANFRISKKAFAIACQTTMSSENHSKSRMNVQWCLIWSATEQIIQKHLKEVFYQRVQYICISSPRDPSPNPSVVYIQIILHKPINVKAYFMKQVAGLCKLCQWIDPRLDCQRRVFLDRSL